MIYDAALYYERVECRSFHILVKQTRRNTGHWGTLGNKYDVMYEELLQDVLRYDEAMTGPECLINDFSP